MFRRLQTTLAWAKTARGSNLIFALIAIAAALGAPAFWVGAATAALYLWLAA